MPRAPDSLLDRMRGTAHLGGLTRIGASAVLASALACTGLACAGVGGSSVEPTPAEPAALSLVSRTRIAPPSAARLLFSPSLEHALYADQDDDGWWVGVDSERVGGPYTAVSTTWGFSPDESRQAHVATTDAGWWVVVGDERLGPFDGVSEKPVAFAPDASHFAFTAFVGDDAVVMVDGVERGRGTAASQPMYGLDGRLMYVLFDEGGSTVVVGDETFGPWPEAWLQRFTDDGRAAWTARGPDGVRLYLDGRPSSDAFEQASGFTSIDGHWAFLGARGGEYFVVDDRGQLGPFVDASAPALGPDGAVGFVARHDDGLHVHVADWVSPVQSEVGDHVPSIGKGGWAWWSRVEGDVVLWYRDERVTELRALSDRVPQVVDGTVAYAGVDDSGAVLAVGAWKSAPYSSVFAWDATKDGSHIAGVVRDADGVRIVGGTAGGGPNLPGFPITDPGTAYGGGLIWTDSGTIRATDVSDGAWTLALSVP